MLRSLVCVLALCAPAVAAAQPAGIKGYAYCYARLNDAELVTPVFPWPDKDNVVYEIEGNWEYYLRREWGFRDGNLHRCSMTSSEAETAKFRQIYLQRSGGQTVDFVPLSKARKAGGPVRKPTFAKESPDRNGNRPGRPAEQVTEAPTKNREQREAEWQAKVAAHEAEVAEHQKKVREREAEIARQRAEHTAAQEKARQAKAAHDAKMANFKRILEEQERRQKEYEAALALNRRCASGERQACETIKTGKPASAEKLVDAGNPATSDDEARICVTDPVLGPSKVWKGALAATMINGCKTAVDARICLLREGGWNCGVYWGLKPQQRWIWTSFKATGDLIWDARIAGSGRPLGEP